MITGMEVIASDEVRRLVKNLINQFNDTFHYDASYLDNKPDGEVIKTMLATSVYNLQVAMERIAVLKAIDHINAAYDEDGIKTSLPREHLETCFYCQLDG